MITEERSMLCHALRLLDLDHTVQKTHSTCSDETHLLSRDGRAHDVLVVTTTMGWSMGFMATP